MLAGKVGTEADPAPVLLFKDTANHEGITIKSAVVQGPLATMLLNASISAYDTPVMSANMVSIADPLAPMFYMNYFTTALVLDEVRTSLS